MDQGNDPHALHPPAPDRHPEGPDGGTHRLPPPEWEGYARDGLDELPDS